MTRSSASTLGSKVHSRERKDRDRKKKNMADRQACQSAMEKGEDTSCCKEELRRGWGKGKS